MRAAWSAAVNRGAPDGPIRAMQSCGNTAAVSYAQHLDGTNIWVGLVFVVVALLVGAYGALGLGGAQGVGQGDLQR